MTNRCIKKKYTADWESLTNYKAPEWYEDAKLGFWVHWGVFSVPAFRGNHAAEWYGRWMYSHENQSRGNMGLAQHQHHCTTYGNPAEFGYKDFIPSFKAEHFNPDEWTDLCIEGGAKFFCMLGAHHDSFCLWDSKLTPWNAANMGPKRDLVGDMAEAVRKKGLKFGVSNHLAWNYAFFQWNHVNGYDAKDPNLSDFYGSPIINSELAGKKMTEGMTDEEWINIFKNMVYPSDADLNRWLERSKELSVLYSPDLHYFDWGMNHPAFESRRKQFGAHYYNHALESNKGKFGAPNVVLNYKDEAFAAGSAVHDVERGRKKHIEERVWQTDDCVYDGHTWGYAENIPIKPVKRIIHDFVDIVSKRGVLMLSFAPKADGSFPEDQKKLITDLGTWLKANGEAIYATRPWKQHAEGENIRFTRSKDEKTIYAIMLEWPESEIVISSIKEPVLCVRLLASGQLLEWEMTENGLRVDLPVGRGGEFAFALGIGMDQSASPSG